jgi:hypothetical protein
LFRFLYLKKSKIAYAFVTITYVINKIPCGKDMIPCEISMSTYDNDLIA